MGQFEKRELLGVINFNNAISSLLSTFAIFSKIERPINENYHKYICICRYFTFYKLL